MTLLQDKLPCSENFFRFQNNYDKVMNDKNQNQDKPTTPTRLIASPRFITSLSPVNSFVAKSDELNKRVLLNINTEG